MLIVQNPQTHLPSSTLARCAWRSPGMCAGEQLLIALHRRWWLRPGHRLRLASGLDRGTSPPWTATPFQSLGLTFVQPSSFALQLALSYGFRVYEMHTERGRRAGTPLAQHPVALNNIETAPDAWLMRQAMPLPTILARSFPALDPALTRGIEPTGQALVNRTTSPGGFSKSRPGGMTALRLSYRMEQGAVRQSLPRAAAPDQARTPAQHPGNNGSPVRPDAAKTGAPSFVDSLFDSAMQQRPLAGFDLRHLPAKAVTDRQVATASATAHPLPQPGPAESPPQQGQWTRNDLSQLADQVDRLLRQRQRLERERRGNS